MQVDTLTPTMHLVPANELHISVSRTVTVRHHWIRPLVDSLRKQLQSKSRFPVMQWSVGRVMFGDWCFMCSFVCAFDGPRFYCNDEKTR